MMENVNVKRQNRMGWRFGECLAGGAKFMTGFKKKFCDAV